MVDFYLLHRLSETFMTALSPYLQISLGEMISYLPISGGHIKLAERFVDPAFSFAMGWNYWYTWAILMPGELSAAAVLMRFWTTVSSFNRV
jgi:amino acid permease